jgi:hypothetical protein
MGGTKISFSFFRYSLGVEITFKNVFLKHLSTAECNVYY